MGLLIYFIIACFVVAFRIILFTGQLMIATVVFMITCLAGKPRWPYWIF
jgi:hypothetical protein